MKIIAIEEKTFEQMKHCFEAFTKQVKELCAGNQLNTKWLTNNDVCKLLNISRRTLQSYRGNGILAYSQIGHRCYYKVTDVEKLIIESTILNPKTMTIDSIHFDMSTLVGNWESVNLHPSVIIYCNNGQYLLSIIHLSETTKQASPATYEIQVDEDGYYTNYNLKRMGVEYDAKLDELIFSSFGKYMRN